MGYDKDVMAPLIDVLKTHVRKVMQGFSALELLNGDEAESFVRDAVCELSNAIGQVWPEEAIALGLELGGVCPRCGGKRTVRQRTSMTMKMLGVEVEVPKPYLECAACDAPGISIMRVLTGLRSGATSFDEAFFAYDARPNEGPFQRRRYMAHREPRRQSHAARHHCGWAMARLSRARPARNAARLS